MKKMRFLMVGALSAALVLSACSDKEDEATKDEGAQDVAAPSGELLALSGDTVSEQGGCVLASRFMAGDKIIFRANAIDPETNEQLKDAKLQVHLSTGETLDMEYGPHDQDNFWVVAYPVTEDTPTGALDYYITGESGDAKVELHPFDVTPSKLMIVEPEEEEQPAS